MAAIITGQWLVFISRATPEHSPMSTAGLTTIKVVVIIQMVCSCLLALLFEFATIIGAMAQPTPAAPDPQAVSGWASQPDTTVLGQTYVPETTVLSAAQMLPVQLVREKDGSTTYVTKDQFTIGKDPNAVDLYIGDNSAVSRQHAKLLIHDGQAFVVDLSSTNHIFLDGQQIPANTQMALENGMMLRLGDENFRVIIG